MTLVKELIKFSDKLLSPDISVEKKYKVLKAIKEFDISINDLHESKLGRAVKKCSKLSGKTGLLAQKFVAKWKKMINDTTNGIQMDEMNNDDYDECSNENKKSKMSKSENVDYSNLKSRQDQRQKSENNDIVKKYSNYNKDNVDQSYSSNDSESDKSEQEYFNAKKIENDHGKNVYTKEKFSNRMENPTNDYRHNKNSIDAPIKSSTKMENFTKENHSQDMKLKAEKIQHSTEAFKPTRSEKSKYDVVKHKSRKSDAKHITTFENFLKDSAISQHNNDSHANKRKSAPINNEVEHKKVKLQSDRNTNLLSNDLPDLPLLSSSLSDDDMNEQSINNRIELMQKNKNQNQTYQENQEDVDCTSKYSSERKIWMPNRRNDFVEQPPSSPEYVKTINGVSEHIISQYDYQKLMAFEADDRKTMKQTECFWEKLFKKVHKCYQRKESEKWREAFLRVQREIDQKLKELSARVKRNNEEKIQAVNKAKLLNCVPGKNNRRITDMRR